MKLFKPPWPLFAALALSAPVLAQEVSLAPTDDPTSVEAPKPPKLEDPNEIVSSILDEADDQIERKQKKGRRGSRRHEDTATRESAYDRAPREAFAARQAGKIGRR